MNYEPKLALYIFSFIYQTEKSLQLSLFLYKSKTMRCSVCITITLIQCRSLAFYWVQMTFSKQNMGQLAFFLKKKEGGSDCHWVGHTVATGDNCWNYILTNIKHRTEAKNYLFFFCTPSKSLTLKCTNLKAISFPPWGDRYEQNHALFLHSIF